MTLEDHLTSLELGYFELGEAFKGLADENVWKRPAEGLLSIGELAGHLSYWEAVRIAYDGVAEGERPDLEKCKVKSLLIDERFRYYSKTIDTTPSSEHLSMTAEQVWQEVLRVHQESVAHLKALNPDLGIPAPWWHSSYDDYLRYGCFHAAYHTGQIYSARHLLGEETPDN